MPRTVPELENVEFCLPPQVNFVGSCIWEPDSTDRELEMWITDRRNTKNPILYVQPGRNFKDHCFWPSLRDALEDKAISVVASLGKIDEKIGRVAQNFFVRQHVPMNKVLPHSSAVVATGHTTAVLGALIHGLPSLLLPSYSASDEIAFRCEKAGVALCFYELRNGISSRYISRLIDKLLNNQNIKNNAKKFQQFFARAGDAELAGSLIEELGLSWNLKQGPKK